MEVSKPRMTAGSSLMISKKSASMEVLRDSTPPLPRTKSFSIEFPTSPPPAGPLGEGMLHYTHSQHPLAQLNLPELFVCSGCKEYGAGKRFACRQCDFQLHDFCAFSPPLLKFHPLHAQHQLVFHSKPKTGVIRWPKCNVCGKATKGFTFRCKPCNFQMHPCCAMLSAEIKLPAHPHNLKLLPPGVTFSNGDSSGSEFDVCGECKRKRSGRIFGCTANDCNYHLHAVCAKSMLNGLHANGIKIPQNPPKVLGATAGLASQVIIEFISGLFEGFGEGVGDALIQNVFKGRCLSRRRIE